MREKENGSSGGEAYKIYYLNTSVTKLAPYEYHTETTDTELLIQELMEQFLKVPNDVDSQAALSDRVGYRGYRLEERILYLYFDGGYSPGQYGCHQGDPMPGGADQDHDTA